MAISVDAIDAAINALVLEQQVNYSNGSKSFSNGDKIRQLMELRQSLANTPQVELDCVTFDGEILLNGFDLTQFAVP